MSTRILTTLALFCLACTKTVPEPTGQTPPVTVQAGVKTFGAPVAKGAATSVAKILENPDDFVDKSVIAEGEVKAVCQKKGCWMELSDGSAKGSCRITFKDYGFFVPKDAMGSRARVEGEIKVRELTKDQVDHLEKEGATLDKQPDGSARQLTIVAAGVELR